MEKKNELLLRVYLICIGFVIFAAMIIGKVVKTAIVEGDEWRSKGQQNMRWMNVEGERGSIYDVHGNLLATSLPYFDIKIDLLTSKTKVFEQNIGPLSQQLAEHFGKTASEWESQLSIKRREGMRVRRQRASGDSSVSSNAGFYPLLYKLTKKELDLLKKFPLLNLGKYEGGLIVERKTRRERPYRSWAKRTIGIDRADNQVGLERSFDRFLKGQTEKRLMRKVPGQTWLPMDDATEMLKEKGSDVITTLDMHIQDVVHNELESALITHNAENGVALVMEVETGAIRAISNLKRMSDGSYDEYHNDAIGKMTEPGSTFKLISALAMLESGKIGLDTEIDLFGGKKKFFDYNMYDSHRHGIRKATFKEAFAISSNVGMGYAAYKIFGKKDSGWNAFYDALDRMGVLDVTGIEIYGEKKPQVKKPGVKNKNEVINWSGTTVPWMAHGYELMLSPLQILNFYNAVANDGKLMKPYLVSEVVDEDGVSTRYSPKVLRENIASPETILKAKELLKAVAESGTASGLKVEGLSFAGKTGTTKLEYWKDTESYDYNASFAGYFPEERPKYSMIVVVYSPEGRDYYGAKVAGPVFRNVMKRLSGYEGYKTLDVDDEPKVLHAHSGHRADYEKVLDFIGMDYEESGNSNWAEMKPGHNLQLKSKRIKKNIVPDVKGEGLRDALFLLESLGMEVEVEGVGKVYKQSQRAGQEIKIKKIKIFLN